MLTPTAPSVTASVPLTVDDVNVPDATKTMPESEASPLPATP